MNSGDAPARKHGGLFGVLDFFARPQYGSDAYSLSRARALIGTNLMLLAVFGAASLHLLARQSLGNNSFSFLAAVVGPALAINLVVPFLVRRYGWLRLGQHLTLLTTAGAAFSGIYFNGGPVDASSNQTLLIVSPLAFFLLGKRGGLAWSALCLAGATLLYTLHFNGYAYPNLQPIEAQATGEVFNFLVCFAAIVIFLLLIESNRQKLEQLRNVERDHLSYMANHDGLTRLANRVLFEKRLGEALRAHRDSLENCIMFYIDLDAFKPVNDQYGHGIGDEVLKIIALRLQSVVRDSDTVARLGGDEFAIIFNRFPISRSIEEMARIIYERISQPITLGSQTLQVTGTIGISLQETDSTTASMWQASDSAMYAAKRAGRHWQVADAPNI